MALLKRIWGSSTSDSGEALTAKEHDELRNSRLELLLAVLLGVAALGTAIASYQSGKESGSTILSYNLAIRSVNETSQQNTVGNQILVRDQAIFLEFAKAAQGDENDELLAYIQTSLMSPQLRAAVEWWAEQPGDEFQTPFVKQNPKYRNLAFEQAAKLKRKTAGYFTEAQAHDTKGGRFDLVTVLFAASLFILGIATVVRAWNVKLVVVGLGSIIFLGSLIQLGRIYWS